MVLQNILISKLTTLEIGGPVSKFTEVSNFEELKSALEYAKKEDLKFLVIGGGSNLLVSDEGYDGFIIKNLTQGIHLAGNELSVESGTILQDLVDFTIANGLSGMNKLTGIPGTVGGALFGNAGAYGQTISDHLVKVICFDGEKETELTKDECKFNYRDSAFKKSKSVIFRGVFNLELGDAPELKKESDETLKKRLVKYPIGIKCPGSFFKNIVASTLPDEILRNISEDKIMYGKIPAGKLLEEVGAKGDAMGQIKIAEYHGNLFINLGDGKAEDFYNLAKKYFQKVKEKFRIELEPEVQLINLPPLNQF
jgi:UDP-N-acetylmuramate dehydrogenase